MSPNNTNSNSINGIDPSDITDLLKQLVGDTDGWSEILSKVLSGKQFSDSEWLEVFRAILNSVERNLLVADPMRPLIKTCRDVIDDNLLTGSDLVVIGVALATNYQAPQWLYDIARKATEGDLTGADFEDLVKQFVGANNAVLFNELLTTGVVSSKTLLAALSIVLYRLGMLDQTSPSFTLDDDTIQALLQKGLAILLRSSDASDVYDEVGAFLQGVKAKDYGKALLAMMRILGVTGVPSFVEELLKGTALKTLALDELKKWLNGQIPGGTANDEIAEELFKLLDGTSTIFSQNSDIDEWKTAYPDMFYPRVLAIRRLLFYAKVASTAGGTIPTTRDAPPVLLGLWVKPATKINDILPKDSDKQFLRAMIAAEFPNTYVLDKETVPGHHRLRPPNINNLIDLVTLCKVIDNDLTVPT